MKQNDKKTSLMNKKIYIFTALIFFYIIVTIFMFFLANTSKSYSLTQQWQEYYSIEDWNLDSHAIVDIDNDGKKDIVTFTNCAFLSSINIEKIPLNKRCEAYGMSNLAFPNNSVTVGQKLYSLSAPLTNGLLHKSYLVKTQQNKWKYYHMEGLLLHVYELGTNKLFHEVKPTFLDYIDTCTYYFSHLGISALLFLPHIPNPAP